VNLGVQVHHAVVAAIVILTAVTPVSAAIDVSLFKILISLQRIGTQVGLRRCSEGFPCRVYATGLQQAGRPWPVTRRLLERASKSAHTDRHIALSSSAPSLACQPLSVYSRRPGWQEPVTNPAEAGINEHQGSKEIVKNVAPGSIWPPHLQ